MALKDLKFIDSEDREIVKIQENMQTWTRQLNRTMLSGILLDEVTIATSETLVPHLLGRAFQGWQIIDLQGDARVWRVATSTANTSLFLPLRASASVVVKLWVF